MESCKTLRLDMDVISVLPKHLISNILSKLPTKDAIKTSSLSKGWEFNWTTVTNLDLSDEDIYDRDFHDENGEVIDIAYYDEIFKDFRDRINAVLSQLETTSIDKLSFLFKICSNRLLFKELIRSALKRNVRDLGLHASVFMVDPIKLPRQVFDCESLEALTLNDGIVFNIPRQGFVCFPNLKFLSLERVDICGIPAKESSACFPKLETLRLKFVAFIRNDECVMQFVRNCPVLKNLSIARYVDVDDGVWNAAMCIPSLTSTHLYFAIDYVGCIEIGAPIKHLRVTFSNPGQNVLVKNLDSLIAVQLEMSLFDPDFDDGDDSDEQAQRSLYYSGEQPWDQVKLIKTFDKVKCLALTRNTVQAIQASNIELPLFCNLTRLVVTLVCKELCVLQRLLNNSPNLQNLVVVKWSHAPCCQKDKRGSDLDTEESRFRRVPKCLLTSLKWVEIQDSCGCKCDLDLIRNILESAKILKRLTTKSEIKYMEFLRHKVSAFPRASAACQVDFCFDDHCEVRSCFEEIGIPRSMEHESFLFPELYKYSLYD